MQDDFDRYADEINRETEEDSKPVLGVISARELQRKDMPRLQYIVERMIVNGLTLLASPPKYGKSWLSLDICLSVASGMRLLGYKTNKTGCLYLALEDSERRLKTRMEKLLNGREAPDGFYYATVAHDMDNGLFDELEGFLKAYPQTGLVVIDTLQKVRGAAHGREGAYAGDYRELAALKAFADKHNIALLLIHHLRKMKDDGDPFNMISGTNGISGAADTMMVLTKEKRDSENATLSIVGRDVEAQDLVIRFNRDTCTWENLGDAEAYAEQQAQQEYFESPLRKTILKLLEQRPDGWSGTMQELLEAGRYITRSYLADTPKELANKVKRMDELLFANDGVIHERKGNGSGGGKHRFYTNDSNGNNVVNGCFWEDENG